MKSFIASLLLVSMFSQVALADVAFTEGKEKKLSGVTLMVIRDMDPENVRFAMAIDGQFHRYLGNKKVYNIAQLNEFSERQGQKVGSDKIRKVTLSLTGAGLAALATHFIFRASARYNVFYFLVMTGVSIAGGIGAGKLHDFFFVTGTERQARSFFGSAAVTGDQTLVYQTTDAVLALAAFEEGLEESGAGVEKAYD